MTTIKGSLEHIIFFNPENYYTVARIKISGSQNPVTVTGFMPGAAPGQALLLKGTWETHLKYGEQFKIDSFEITLPATIGGIKKYLETGFIKGIGQKMADRLINRFGENTLKIIENCPEKLREVEGIGKSKASLISEAWKEQHAAKSLMAFLQEAGADVSFCGKIFEIYGKDAVDIIRENPYLMAKDVPGISFQMADIIARNMETPIDEFERAKACVLHIMDQNAGEGNVYALESQILLKCEKNFKIKPDTAKEAVKALSDSGEFVIEDIDAATAVYSLGAYRAEKGLADRLKAFLTIPLIPPEIDTDRICTIIFKELFIKPSDEQLNLLKEILGHRVVIITGGPGTGKTTLIKSINTLFASLGKEVLLAAPTGRAARRLAEVTKREAKTIHRLLGFNFSDGMFEKNRDNPLDADAVIIDEASMVDIYLMYHMLNAVSMNSVFILVGDIFQLPSVGPGNVLADMIKSEKIPVFYLKKIFRQTQESPIIINAHRVREGKLPAIKEPADPESLSEFYFIRQNNPDKVVSTIVELCSRAIPERFNFNPVYDIQVITPMHKGAAGTINLNQVLQNALNQNSIMVKGNGMTFKKGDKVMHLKNNYAKEVFNGDIGIITSIEKSSSQLLVKYYQKEVKYNFDEINELALAYAISVHKSQGSEYPAVIVPIMTQHFALLQRNLLYTAITRGKKLVIITGTERALEIAIENNRPENRFSGLAYRLGL